MKRFLLLEPLRGFAALWVLLYHFRFSLGTQEAMPWLVQFCRHGHLGVPMFFVISGICIAAAAQGCLEKNQPTMHFVRRRLRRIYPPFWFSIAVVALLPFVIEVISSLKTGTFTPPSADHPNLGYLRYSVIDWLSVGSLLKVFDSEPAVGSLQAKFTSLNAVYWTLAIEVQFYLAMALGLFNRRWFALTIVAISVVAIGSMFVPGAGVSGIFLPYWPMFACGLVLFCLLHFGWSSERLAGRWSVAVAGVACGLAIAAAVALGFREKEIDQLAFAGGFAALLFGAIGLEPLLETWQAEGRGWVRWLMLPAIGLGAMSYTVYLLHGRVQFLSMQVGRQILDRNSMAYDALVVAMTLGLCVPFYWLCERPFIGGGAKPKARLATVETDGLQEQVVMPMGAAVGLGTRD